MLFKNRVFVFFLLLFVACAVYGVPVRAQGIDPSTIRDIPSFRNELPEAEFRKMASLYEEEPYGDKYLAYKIMLPKGWTKSQDAFNTAKQNESELSVGGHDDPKVSRRLLGEVARYYGPVQMVARSRVEILALELEHEITARNWFLNYVFSNGFTLQGMKVVSERRVEGLYVALERDIPYVVRMVTEINGPRMVLVKYFLPDSQFKNERAIQEYVINSFEFTAPELAQAELKRTYAFLDLLRFDYPSSWRLVNPEIYDVQEMSAFIMNSRDQKTLSGEIKVSVVSTELDTDIPNEISLLKEDLAERGLGLGDLIEVPDIYEYHDHVLFHRVEVYKVLSSKQKIVDHEFWVAIMMEDRYYYIVTMITPGRGVDFYNWARNTEAFEKVITTIRP